MEPTTFTDLLDEYIISKIEVEELKMNHPDMYDISYHFMKQFDALDMAKNRLNAFVIALGIKNGN